MGRWRAHPGYGWKNARGSTLLAIALFLVAFGALANGGIQLYKRYQGAHKADLTAENIILVETALKEFMERRGRLPCPALMTAPLDDAQFGIENCAGTPSSTGRAGRVVRTGTVPVRTLNLPDNAMTDGWGRRFTYAVTEAMTAAGASAQSDMGAITLVDSSGNSVTATMGGAYYALLSAGEDQRGAYDSEGRLLEACDASSMAGQNCDGDASFVMTSQRSDADGNTYTQTYSYMAGSVAYSWYVSSWSGCNGTCNSGTQTRVVECRDNKNSVVADSFCLSAKPVTSQTCPLPVCAWTAGPWGVCSNTCGSGTQTRSVICERVDSLTVNDSFCDPATEPSDTQACTSFSSCTYSWEIGGWGACSGVCDPTLPPNDPQNGVGEETRSVQCKRSDGTYVADSFCSQPKPDEVQSCSVSCAVHGDCMTPWGVALSEGSSVVAYQESNPTGCSPGCVSEVRVCEKVGGGASKPKLTGSYQYQSCTELCNGSSDCLLPWGGTVADGQSVVAYKEKSVRATQCTSEIRTCNSGVLSGSYEESSCFGIFPGSIDNPLDLCSTCALEDRNEMKGLRRYLLNNDQDSIDQRCKELGYKRGEPTSIYTYSEWCANLDARTKEWNPAKDEWRYRKCQTGNVKSANCYYE